MTKRILAIVLSVMMIVTFLPVTALAAVDLPDGAEWLVNEGDNHVWWKLEDSNTKLTIGGEGAIPDSVEAWDSHKTDLTSVVMESGVTAIGDQTFAGFEAIINIEIPDSVTNIGDDVFYGCTALTAINVSNSNANYTSVDGVLFNKEKTVLFRYPIGKSDTTYTIPAGVTEIGEDAFEDCATLTNVTIPTGVTKIGSSAFSDCDNLLSIVIPKGVTALEDYTFDGCTSLASVTLPEGLETIGEEVFWDCDALVSIVLPASLTKIGSYVFECSDNFETVTLLSTMPPELVNDAFQSTALSKVYVPAESVEAYQTAEKWSAYADKIEAMPAEPHTHGTGDNAITFDKVWKDATKLPDTAGNYYLDTDVTLESRWYVPAGTTNLCLNGHVIKPADGKKGSVISVPSEATLNLYDCGTTEHAGYIDADGLWHLGTGTGTAKTIEGGIITGGTTGEFGGGVYIDGGSFTMNGGTIGGNKSDYYGGGVSVNYSGNFVMNGGTISNNKALCAGGVGVLSGSFIMNDGIIGDNAAKYYGGVYVEGDIIMTGGSITGNKATERDGSGVYYYSGTVTLGGTAKIADNKKSDDTVSNVYLPYGAYITLGTKTVSDEGNGVAAPEDGFDVGVTTEKTPASGSPAQITANGASTDTEYFTSDNDAYEVKFNTDHLELAVKVVPHVHSFTYTANGGTITATCTEGCDKGYDTKPLTLTLTAPESLAYDGNVKAFTFADGEADAWEAAGLELPTIYYYIKQSTQSEYIELLGTLKDAGNYMAKITVGEKTAQVEFTIDEEVAKIGDTTYESLEAAFKEAKEGDQVVLMKDVPLSTADVTVPEGVFLDLNHHVFRTTGKIVNNGCVILYQENADIAAYLLVTVPGAYGTGEELSIPNTTNPDYILPADTFLTNETVDGKTELGFASGEEPLVWNADVPAGLNVDVTYTLALGGDILSTAGLAPVPGNITTRVTATNLILNDNITIGSNVGGDGGAVLTIESLHDELFGDTIGTFDANGKTITLNLTGRLVVSADIDFDESVLVSGVDGATIVKTVNEEDGTVTYTVHACDLGDVNGDGLINMKDVLALRRHLVELETAYVEANADCNQDAEVNMKDVLMLRQYLVGIITEFGAEA